MIGRLIGFSIVLIIIVTFIGFNFETRSDIHIWFGEKGVLEDVPIFVSFFVMFVIGFLSALTYVLLWRRQKRRETLAETERDAVRKGSPVRVLGAKKSKDDEAAPEGNSADEGE